ncbi:metal ABC transporter solute-binding protein, Zn/Mn family [Blastopirellula marina]|uniref:ABC transporter substrate-binding protein n=1 Tax=Blastopirellula marina TaxID=124 RepID=A0A2S8G9L5_9BACT|nr:zinc ABC transporter substrate-binding protein [Blastopirellula marina]PQO41155.1 ABC transporter substrate-binding protein [Blastopirellula marina]PTL46031.1 ABC transporter substrate-binding protein [Blastopirellula marina]
MFLRLLSALLLGLSLFGPLVAEDRKPVIVCSTTQVADFARQVVGDRMIVKSVLAAGQDPHLYEKKPGDAQLVSTADLCLENGWHLEGNDWMRKLAEQSGRPLVTCVEGCKSLKVPGVEQAMHDPHAWFSCTNAATYVRNIRDAVIKIDPEHAEEYRSRAALYLDELRTLHSWILREINKIPVEQRVLVTSHDAFNYFCQAYGLKAATPVGWSTGNEIGAGITPERRQETIDSILQHKVKAIFVETSVNPTMVREIAREAHVEIGGELYSDSMGAEGTAGETYIGMMRENVITIVQALR